MPLDASGDEPSERPRNTPQFMVPRIAATRAVAEIGSPAIWTLVLVLVGCSASDGDGGGDFGPEESIYGAWRDEPDTDPPTQPEDAEADEATDQSRPSSTASPPPPPGDCDPEFRGPFCEGDRIIGFEPSSAPSDPTLEEVRQYNLEAVNHLRGRTCLPALVLDDCLHDIADRALEIGGFHTYFQESCMNAEHGFGRQCECNWRQENIGMAAGTSRTWEDGVQVPLCAMMEEPFGVGHRANIEHPDHVRLGVGIDWDANGASWHHEFGCEADLESCP